MIKNILLFLSIIGMSSCNIFLLKRDIPNNDNESNVIIKTKSNTPNNSSSNSNIVKSTPNSKSSNIVINSSNKSIINANSLNRSNQNTSLTNSKKNKVVKRKSQLNLLEKRISNDKALTTKFNNFKKDGLEKSIVLTSNSMERVIAEAKKYLGTPHKMGGLSKSGIDCSGLLYISFNSQRIKNVPRTAQEFARLGKIIVNPNDLRRGDLVFFINTYSTNKLITHAGIVIADNQFIHTSSSKGVKVDLLNSKYWKSKFFYGTRIIN